MTTLAAPAGSAVTYPLSPFQRAALAYSARPLSVTVDIEIAPDVLAERAERAVNASPELTAILRPVPGLRVPRQHPSVCTRESPRPGEWRLAAGSLLLSAVPHTTRTRLTIDADALLADARSIEILCRRIADDSSDVGGVRFFDAATGHAAMVQEGELDAERKYWQAVTRVGDARTALGVAPGPAQRRVAVTRPSHAPRSLHSPPSTKYL